MPPLPAGTPCDTGNPCSPVGVCNGVAPECLTGPVLELDDGNDCTVDACGGTGVTHAPRSLGSACLGGSCCQTCGTADFNGDGDTGTDADIEAFFRVLGGGTC